MSVAARPVAVLLVSGSLRAGSSNVAVLRTVAAIAPAGVRTDVHDGLASLPHFNPDDDFEPLPSAVIALRAAIAAADAVLFCTPEYAGALPGSFKNLLDWTVGGGEIYGKPVAWINASSPAAPTGGADAHASLRTVLGYTGADIVEDACVRVAVARSEVGVDGLIGDEAIRGALARSLAALVAHVVPPAPVACSLPMARLDDRRATWQRLAREALVDQRETAEGVRLEYAASDGVEDQLRDLARLEADCCSFARWDVAHQGDRVVLSVRAEGEGVPAIQALFAG